MSLKSESEVELGARDESEQISVDKRFYSYDAARLDEFRRQEPWTKNPKQFQRVALSPSAILKIMMHCQSGVEKGVAKGGNPVEVMGMLLGKPDPPDLLVVTDAFPLPIEGFETRVIADDESVVNHMIALGESLEHTRKEKFMGWYHSHPFDLTDRSHCFLSQTDLSTQLQWQRAEDPHGNPFVAIVVDPLRSMALKTPQLKAFRAYPPEYSSSIAHECPDGSVEPSEQVRLEHWGSCWARYYELKIEYFMSSTSRSILEPLTLAHRWRSVWESTPQPQQSASLYNEVAKQIQLAGMPISAAASGTPGVSSSGTTAARRTTSAESVQAAAQDWDQAVKKLSLTASEQTAERIVDEMKQVFY